MKSYIFSFVSGFIFSLGLGISGMTKPAKVLDFLDIAGNWDASLLFVMAGAISVHFIAYQVRKKMQKPILTQGWNVPTKTNLTPSLIIGSSLFGIGWGLAGYCPGPAIASLPSLQTGTIVFVGSMLVGMIVFLVIDKFMSFNR